MNCMNCMNFCHACLEGTSRQFRSIFPYAMLRRQRLGAMVVPPTTGPRRPGAQKPGPDVAMGLDLVVRVHVFFFAEKKGRIQRHFN